MTPTKKATATKSASGESRRASQRQPRERTQTVQARSDRAESGRARGSGADRSSPPQTGNAAVDDALLGLADLASAPLAEHHDRLAKAHEALQEALDRPDDGSVARRGARLSSD